MSQLIGQREKVIDVAIGLFICRRIDGSLVGSQNGNFGSHENAVDFVPACKRHGIVVAGGFEVGVQKAVREIFASVNAKVCSGENRIAERIDNSKRLIELDAIKGDELVIPADDVVEMKIAMALTNVLLPFA